MPLLSSLLPAFVSPLAGANSAAPPGTPTDRFGNPVQLRSPQQAHRRFGFDQGRFSTDGGQQSAAPRPKNLFYVLFQTNLLDQGIRNQSLAKTLGFSCKAIERPTVQ